MKMRPSYFAFKIKDGVFIGDGNSPNQLEFLFANKITTIINCAGSEIIVNHNVDIRVINFQWLDNDEEIILDETDSNFQSIFYFIQDTHHKFESVLICSLRGQSRALTIITAYLIKKYKWSLYKTLEYMNSKRNDFEIRANFLKQLVAFQSRLFGKKLKNCTKTWDECQLQQQGQLVKNTYINSLRNKNYNIYTISKKQPSNKKTVKFIENATIIEKSFPVETQKQQDLTIIQLNKVIEKREKNSNVEDQVLPKKKIKQHQRSKTQITDDIQFQFAFKQPMTNLSGNKARRVVTPYRIRRNSEKIQKIKTQPKQDVQLNINLNINAINIISGSEKHREKFLQNNLLLQKRRTSKKSSLIFNQEKIKMFLHENSEKKSIRKPRDQPFENRPNSSFSKRLSFDNKEQRKKPLKSIYNSKKQWITNNNNK